MKEIIRLFSVSISRYMFFIKATSSLDFMIRYTILWLFYILNALFFGIFKRFIQKIQPYFNKEFIIKTSFGIFLWRTVLQWVVLSPDYEIDIKKVIKKSISNKYNENKKIFLNIGSHTGRYAIELSKNYGYDSYCFEPTPETFDTLKINTILSNVQENVKIYNFALWNVEWFLDFLKISHNEWWNSIVQKSSKDTIKVPVKVYDLLNLWITPDLVLIDVEWFEYEVLDGMRESLKKRIDLDIIIEIFQDSWKKEKTISLMQELWYKYKKIDEEDYHFYKI